MTTATIISELLPFHDDALLADIEHIFDELDRSVELTPPGEAFVIMLLVDELGDEMLDAQPAKRDELTIEISLDLDRELSGSDVYTDRDEYAEVAEVA
jgi:hypothetical protein